MALPHEQGRWRPCFYLILNFLYLRCFFFYFMKLKYLFCHAMTTRFTHGAELAYTLSPYRQIHDYVSPKLMFAQNAATK